MISRGFAKTFISIGQGLLIGLMLLLAGCHDNRHSYAMGGQVSGLDGAGLVLANNGTTPLAVPAGSRSFAFSYRLRRGSQYNVTIASQPENQICTVTNGTGTVRHTITDIRVACNVETHSVAGSIAGLGTAGLVLQLNGADNLVLAANAETFEFATPIAAGSGYHVTILTQPPGLVCTVNNGTGTNINADIGDVMVVCSSTMHDVGGTITGLTGTGLVLQNNGAADLSVLAGSGSFQFTAGVADGGVYDVTVLVPPIGQSCSIVNGSGIAHSNVTSISITCVNIPTYTVTPSAGANGSISPNSPVSVNQGDSIGFVATPNVGYTVSQWLVNGVSVQSGGSIYTLANVTANATVAVEFGTVVLSASVGNLALSVNDTATNPALTGSTRSITITNVGSLTATNVSFAVPSLPSGTFVDTSSCGSSLAAGSSCSVTVTPGSTATSSCTSGIAPTPDTVTVSADGAPDIAVNVVVLGYGCIYQGGYMFAVDDTTASTSSIGGKVVTTVDQSPAAPNGVIWSSRGSGPTSADVDMADVGVSEADVTPCVGASDGACNSSLILSHYAATAVPLQYFAAGQCAATISGYSDWYLPAVCEAESCGTGQNMQDSLVEFNNLNLLAGFYWTSTQFSGMEMFHAWAMQFDPVVGSSTSVSKDNRLGVRCARALSH